MQSILLVLISPYNFTNTTKRAYFIFLQVMGNPNRMHTVCMITSHFTISSVHDLVISKYRRQGVFFPPPCKEGLRMAFISLDLHFEVLISFNTSRCNLSSVFCCTPCACVFCHTHTHRVKCSNSYK